MLWPIGALVLVSAAEPADSLAQRRAKIEAMSPVEKQELRRMQERFVSLPAAEQQSIRRIAAQLAADPEGQKLRQVLVRYHEWLKTLSAGQRAELVELPWLERVARIKHFKAHQAEQRSSGSIDADPLSPADLRHVLHWLEDYALQNKDLLTKDLPAQRRKHLEELDRPKQRRSLLWLAWQHWQSGAPGDLPPPDTASMQRLAGTMSAGPREQLEQAPTPKQYQELVKSWVRQAVRHRVETLGPGHKLNAAAQDEMQRFFQQDLSPRQREQLLKLPREQMQRELRRLYLQHSNQRPPGPGPARAKRPNKRRQNRPRPSETEPAAAPAEPAAK